MSIQQTKLQPLLPVGVSNPANNVSIPLDPLLQTPRRQTNIRQTPTFSPPSAAVDIREKHFSGNGGGGGDKQIKRQVAVTPRRFGWNFLPTDRTEPHICQSITGFFSWRRNFSEYESLGDSYVLGFSLKKLFCWCIGQFSHILVSPFPFRKRAWKRHSHVLEVFLFLREKHFFCGKNPF